MNFEELKKLLHENETSLIEKYLDRLISKLENINKTTDKVSLLLLFIVLVYFLIRNSLITRISLSLIELNDLKIGLIGIPPIFTFLFLYLSVINAHRGELYKYSKIVSHYLQNKKLLEPSDLIKTPILTRMLLPFSFWEDINKFNYQSSKYGCIATFLTLPLIVIIFLPFWFEFTMLKLLILNYWNLITAKISIIVSVWMSLYIIFLHVKLIKEQLEKSKSRQNEKISY